MTTTTLFYLLEMDDAAYESGEMPPIVAGENN